MKKKIFTLLLSLVCFLCLTLAFTACSNENGGNESTPPTFNEGLGDYAGTAGNGTDYHTHALVYMAEKAKTCTENGNKECWLCACGVAFSDAQGQNQITDYIILASHELEEVAGVAKTCTTDGVYEHVHCTDCGKNFEDATAAKEIDQTVIPASHELTHFDRLENTCFEDGNLEHWHCSVCEKNFKCKVEIDIVESELVENHIPTTKEYASVLLAKDHIMQEVLEKTATCTEDGNRHHYACIVCGKTADDVKGEVEKNDVIFSKLGHNYVENVCTRLESDGDVCGYEGKVIFGNVYKAATINSTVGAAPLANITVQMINKDFIVNGRPYTVTAVTDANGRYFIDGLVDGEHTLKIENAEYVTIEQDVVITDSQYANDKLYLVKGDASEERTLLGNAIDNKSYEDIVGMTVNIYKGVNGVSGEPFLTLTTDENGNYSATLPIGNYVIEFVDERELEDEDLRYATKAFVRNILPEVVNTKLVYSASNGQLPTFVKVTLSWSGANAPRDLDLHLVASNGDVVNWQNKNDATQWASMDRDIKNISEDPNGVEMITINKVDKALSYTFYVHAFPVIGGTNVGEFLDSNAVITIYFGDKKAAEYSLNDVVIPEVPEGEEQPAYNYWKVFTYSFDNMVEQHQSLGVEGATVTP